MENKKNKLNFINIPSGAIILESESEMFIEFYKELGSYYFWLDKEYATTFNKIGSIVNVGIVKDWEYNIYSYQELLVDGRNKLSYKPIEKISGDNLSGLLLENYPIHNIKKLEWEK